MGLTLRSFSWALLRLAEGPVIWPEARMGCAAAAAFLVGLAWFSGTWSRAAATPLHGFSVTDSRAVSLAFRPHVFSSVGLWGVHLVSMFSALVCKTKLRGSI